MFVIHVDIRHSHMFTVLMHSSIILVCEEIRRNRHGFRPTINSITHRHRVRHKFHISLELLNRD